MLRSSTHIDTEKFSAKLRSKAIIRDQKRILISRFSGTVQEGDLSLPPNCGGFGRVHHFHRSMGEGFPQNSLPIDPALNFLGLPTSDMIQVQVFQNAVCSWRCWYCFVDYKLLSGNPKYSEFKTVEELLDLFQEEEFQPSVIDLSGGQPDLVPEWTLWFADEIKKRGLDTKIYLWSDDNLSNDYLWQYLTNEEIQRLASYKNYGRVGCFKGFDERSFSFNTNAEPELFNSQFRLMKKIVNAGFDVYGYATFTTDDPSDILNKMKKFVDDLQSIVHPLFPLRTIPLRVFEYSPTKNRMTDSHKNSIKWQRIAFEAWSTELAARFSPTELAKPIYEHKLI